MRFRVGYLSRLLSFCMLLAGLAGCSVLQPISREAAVEQAARERWTLLIAGKVDEAYDRYVSPASKTLLTSEQYRGSIKLGLWKGAGVAGVSCETDELCRVLVNVQYAYRAKMGGMMENTAAVAETWRKVDGRWWFVVEK